MRNWKLRSLFVEENTAGEGGQSQAGAALQVCARNILSQLRPTNEIVDEVTQINDPAQRTGLQLERGGGRKRHVDVALD